MTKVDLRAVRVKIYVMVVDPQKGIQMNRKELTNTFMMIFNWKNPFDLCGFYKIIQRCKG